MDKAKQERIKRFVSDKLLSDAIYNVLMDSFIKPREGDVYVQASAKIAIDNLQDAWKALQRVQSERSEETNKISGL